MPSRFNEREVIDRRAKLLTQGRGFFDLVTSGDINDEVETADQPSGQQVPTGKQVTIDVECSILAQDGVQIARLREWHAAGKSQSPGYKEKGSVMQYFFSDDQPANSVLIEECWISSTGISGTDQDGTGAPTKYTFTLKVFGPDIEPGPLV